MGRNVVIVVVIIAVIAGAYFVLNSAGIAVVQQTTITTITSSTTTTQTTISTNVVNGVITVSAGSYQDYQVSVPSGALSAKLSGSFTASGGSGNDIIVLVLDQTSFTNWQNGHQVSAIYNSGQLTTSSFSVSLPAGGTYYLVYSNTFSTFSSKNVNTQANLVVGENVPIVVTYTTSYVTTK